jgi:hypothetical protein
VLFGFFGDWFLNIVKNLSISLRSKIDGVPYKNFISLLSNSSGGISIGEFEANGVLRFLLDTYEFSGIENVFLC